MATHVKVIAVLLIIGGACLLALALFAPLILGFVATMIHSSGEPDAEVASTVLGFTGITLSLVLFIIGVPYVVTGWAMLKLRPWSRIAGIVLAALSLIHFPFGTIFGIYALIILFKKETEELFVPARI